MMETLLNLEKELAAWTRLSPEEQQAGEKTASVLKLVAIVQDGLLKSLDACTRATVLRMKFNKYNRKLISLINRYPWPHEIGLALQEALRRLEEDYPDLVDPDEALPRHEKEILVQLVDRHLPVVCHAIVERKLPKVYAHEIRSAFRALFDEDKLPELTYRHKSYIPQLIRASLRLGAEKVSSRWKQHLLELFVNYNLNFMGIYNRWKELRDAEFAAAAEKGEEEACWWAWKETISHYNPKPGMAFDPHNLTLKDHMEIYMRDKKGQVDQKKQHASVEIAKGLRTNNLAGDMAIRFITLQKMGEYPYKTQGEAAEAYVAAHISKNGKEVSPQTLTKHDKTALYMPAKKWHDKVVQIAKYLRKEYGFKDPG